ncbi:MAG: hypothetical protein ACUVUG_02550 [Candidatus Aminicenantia bacterium]
MIFARANPITKQILDGAATEETINIVLDKVAPLSNFELLEVAVFLSEDENYSKRALSLLAEIPYTSLLSYAERREADGKVLDFLTLTGVNEGMSELLEKIIKNPNTGLSSLLLIAEQGSAQELEVIIFTQIKLIAFPELIQGVKKNKNLNPFLSSKLKEIEEEFFVKPEKEKEEKEKVFSAPEPESISEEELSSEILPAEFIEILEPEEKASITKEKYSIWYKISKMKISEKVKMALLGNRNERLILVRDSNKIVALAVFENPKITDGEIEAIAKMRNVSEEVLRKIGTTKEWIKKYQVASALVRNPKTPISVSLSLVNKLLPKDLKDISRSKDLPEAIKNTARRLLDEKA